MEKAELTLSKEQTAALDSLQDKEVKRLIYGGQAGGGKSFLIAIYCYYMAMNYPGTRGYIARDAGIKKIKESILVTCFDVWNNIKANFKFNAQDSFISFPNGSKIVLLDIFHYPSDPNFNALGSTEYTFGCIEEGVTASKKACEILMSRTRYKHDVYTELSPTQLITCNPGEGWIKEEIILPSLTGELNKNTKFIPATLESNPNKQFKKIYRETLESMSDEYDKARLLNGDWLAQPRTGGEFYKCFNEKENTIDGSQYDNEKPLHISFDFNVKPYMTLTIWQIEIFEEKKIAKQIDEICTESPKNNTSSLCSEFKRLYRRHEAGLFIYGDPSGKHEDTRTEYGHNDYKIISKELEQFKPSFRISRKAPSVVLRGKFINEIFEGRIKNLSIFVSKECKNTILDYNFVKEAEDGTKAKIRFKDPVTKVSFEKYGHTSDANDYFLTSIFAKEFNLYKHGGKGRKTAIQRTQINTKY